MVVILLKEGFVALWGVPLVLLVVSVCLFRVLVGLFFGVKN